MRGKRKPPVGAPAAAEWFDLETFMPYQLLVVTDRVSQFFARRYAAEFGITIPESRVLIVIAQYAPLSSREICERTRMAKSRVSIAVSRLVAAGLLTRAVDTEDGRLLSLALSREGKALYRRIVPVALELQARLVAELGPSGREKLMRLLQGVGRAITA
jgi:DNA-binding MarR family transcriptional regulator